MGQAYGNVCYIQILRILSQWNTKTLSTKRLKRLALYSFEWLYHSLRNVCKNLEDRQET